MQLPLFSSANQRPKPPAEKGVTVLDVFDELGFDLVIKRSNRRRTIEIIIRTGQVQLMLPQFVPTEEGLEFVRSKQSWILKTLQRHSEKIENVEEKRYEEGALFVFLGREYPLKIYFSKKPQVQLANNALMVGIRQSKENRADEIKKTLWKWYQQEAYSILSKKTFTLAEKINRSVVEIKLRKTKTKWGHCTTEGTIQYNWQIIAAPEEVVDYLVAHEVSHLVHHNHGVRFWRHVERLYPEYKKHQLWLKQNGHTLSF
ncbi:MAG: M48 family metallopeptidase [Cellvibrionaceae bacterium]